MIAILSSGVALGQTKKEQREAERIAIYTEQLQLTEAEAEKFWPVYRSQKEELVALRKKKKSLQPKTKVEEMSDAEVEKLLDAVLEFKQEELNVKQKYHQKFKQILPIKKVAKLYKLERDYNKIKKDQPPRRPGGNRP